MAGLALLFSATLILQFNLIIAQTYIQNFCFDEYTANSTYEAKLDLLLSSISSNITGNNITFYSSSVGTFPDTIYGIFQCRGDIALEDCKSCARLATTDVKVRCNYKQEATIWYDECWLRYANKVIISAMIGDPKLYFSFGKNVTNRKAFRESLDGLMNGLVELAVSNSTNLFAINEVNVTNSQTIYGLVQCTRDISARDCARCLKKSINQITPCCDHKDSGRILKPSCILWFEVYKFFESNGFSAPISLPNTGGGESSKTVIIVVVPSVVAVVFLSMAILFYLRKERRTQIGTDVDDIPTVESLQFNFRIVATATDNFGDDNKLGEGGFGAVYKGKLTDGRKIAVKRFSGNSSQGAKEFKNEVLLLAKLQHRNLVRLLGFCLEGNQKLLIYEHVLNASLDHFIFDPIKRTILNWEARYKIIGGIARGLLYLHEDSPDKIIHRDLKASNILLDAQMNPKISDFGMARLFMLDQTEGTTSKIAGTYGYMAPEYAMHGQFSVKSDVFSFGVLVLEIITGQRNSSSHLGDVDLLTYAWGRWEENSALELLEPTITEGYTREEVLKCIQIGLLCVQHVERRPTMPSVVLMLKSESLSNVALPSSPSYLVNSQEDLNWIIEEDGPQTSEHLFLTDKLMSTSADVVPNTELYPRR